MRVLLIHPPLTSHPADFPTPEPPLGLAYIAAVLEEKGYEVAILDALSLGIQNVEQVGELVRVGLSALDIKKYVEDFKPDVVGIGAAYSALAADSHKMARLVKQVNPEILTVFGGAHASALPALVLQDKNVDVVVVGEGEITFLELVQAREKGNGIFEIPGTVVRKIDRVVANSQRPYIENLDSLPLPARHLLPMEVYTQRPSFIRDYSLRQPRTSMISSRGCPRDCVFCSIHSVWGHSWRKRPAISVVDEMELLIEKYKIREIAFMDDNLTLDRQRMADICDEILRRKMDIRWCTPNGIAIWALDEELLRKMKASGCWKVTFGIEVAAPETQKFIGKIINLEKADRIIKYANSIGLWTHATFIIGFPYESMDSIEQTVKYALDSDLDIAVFFIATPYPGSKLYKICKEEDLLSSDNSFWSPVRPAWRTKFLTREQLERVIVRASLGFMTSRVFKFLNPLRIKKKVKSWEDIKFMVKLAKSVIGVEIVARKHGRIQHHLKHSKIWWS